MAVCLYKLYTKERAGVNKSESMHMLRHSFATHLPEKGTDSLDTKLLGHNDVSQIEGIKDFIG
jgi:site-specific recombinase XerD